ncbi:MAG: type III polyketide synthase [Roseiflexaceae bacterium]|nr:type III polyketide synthase [Roseiflexaceae bacterium]
MPMIAAVATAVPPYAFSQDQVRDMAHSFFSPTFPHIDRYMSVFENAQITTRYFAAPAEWFTTPHSFQECNDLYIKLATSLSQQAALECLAQAGLTPADVDHLLFVSTTGMSAPSLDAVLINKMAMDRHTRRTPIWGLGCAGGVGGLARAYDYVLAHPTERALLISTELCSTTFQWDDKSKRNFIAASLFADGAAAVLVEGDQVQSLKQAGAPSSTAQAASKPRLSILATQSTTWPATHEVMGWDIVSTGMRVVFSARIPGIVQSLMRENVEELLTPHGLSLDDISHWVLHPGGAKVVTAYESALGIDPERLTHTKNTLRDYGNMSSATVFFVLEQFVRSGQIKPGDYGVMAVLGPGFSCELALVRGQ